LAGWLAGEELCVGTADNQTRHPTARATTPAYMLRLLGSRGAQAAGVRCAGEGAGGWWRHASGKRGKVPIEHMKVALVEAGWDIHGWSTYNLRQKFAELPTQVASSQAGPVPRESSKKEEMPVEEVARFNEMALMAKRSGKDVSEMFGGGTVDERVPPFHTEYSKQPGCWPTGYDAKRGARILWSTYEHERASSFSDMARLGMGAMGLKMPEVKAFLTVCPIFCRVEMLGSHSDNTSLGCANSRMTCSSDGE